jgi:hypothetical protein
MRAALAIAVLGTLIGTGLGDLPAADAAAKPTTKATSAPRATRTAAPKARTGVTASRAVPAAAQRVAPTGATSARTAGRTEVWNVSRPVIGWDHIDQRDWPASGLALSAVSKKDSIVVRRRPGIGEPGLRFTRGQSFTGTPTFLVLQDYLDWVLVAIPVRPNGTVGWVKADEVERFSMVHRVVVDTRRNLMTIERDGVEIARHEVATGTGNTPTPSGLFFVREVVEERADGPYGPYVLGLSGYSTVLSSFDGGEGAIGLHGTNQPGLLGTDASFGCVRMTNQTIFNLVRTLPLGTPVEITDDPTSLPVTRRVRGVPDPVLVAVDTADAPGIVNGISVTDLPEYNPYALDPPPNG